MSARQRLTAAGDVGGGGGRYHLLGHLLGDILIELEEDLDGVVVLVLPMQLLVGIHPQQQLQRRLGAVVLLHQVHVDTQLLLEEPVIQQVLDREPAAGSQRSECPIAELRVKSGAVIGDYLSLLFVRMQPSMISRSSGTITL